MKLDDTTEQLTLSVKSAIMKAWRERSSEMVWGVYLKQALSSHTHGYRDGADMINLSDIMLQQAVVGSSPNALMLSYLRHAIASNVVSCTSALSSIVKLTDYHKQHTMLALMDLIEYLITNIRFWYQDNPGLSLCMALHRVIHWLLQAILHYLHLSHDAKQLKDYVDVIEKACLTLKKTLETSTLRSLVFIARAEEKELYCALEQCGVNVRGTVTQMSPNIVPPPVRDTVIAAITALDSVTTDDAISQPVLRVSHLSICSPVNILVSLEAILNPINSTDLLVEQLTMLQATMNISARDLCSEVLRACMMGLVDTGNSPKDSIWAGFTFLKIPQMFVTLNGRLSNFPQQLELGFERLLNYAPLLDMVDSKWSCDSLQLLLAECQKHNLVSDAQMQNLIIRRNRDNRTNLCESLVSQSIAIVIIKARSTVSSILKTVDVNAKSMDGLLSLLSQILKSFDMLLAAAVASGQLLLFTQKLIKFNEFSKQSQGENNKAAQCRLLVFDISFIILCNIIQVYGIELLEAMSAEYGSSFFVQWAMKSLPEHHQYKSLDECTPTDAGKIDHMLGQIVSGGDIKYTLQLQRWQDTCTNAPFIIQELLFAWEHDVISVNIVKNTLDSMRSQMCCLPIVVVAHICSYINTAPQEAREKPLFIVDYLSTNIEVDPSVQYYKDRLRMMISVLKRMNCDILRSSNRSVESWAIPATSLPKDVLVTCMTQVFTMGWLNQKSLDTLKQLLNLCGSTWLCQRLVDISCLTHEEVVNVRSPNKVPSKWCCDLIFDAVYTKQERGESECTEIKRKKVPILEEVSLLSEGFNIDVINAKEDLDSGSSSQPRSNPLTHALTGLFSLFDRVTRRESTCPGAHFVVSFIKEAVNCGVPYTKFILQSLNTSTVERLLDRHPRVFTDSEMLRLFDLALPERRSLCATIICHNAVKHAVP